jgi:hypothetical protein
MESPTWSTGLVAVLDAIRKNSVHLSNYHKKRYLKYKSYAKYFKIPLIVLSGLNSVISVGLQTYLPQTYISVISCLLSLSCAIITSIELYLGIQKTMENELLASKDFYLLAIDIYKMVTIDVLDRLVNPRAYLEDKYKHYCKLIENSDLVVKKLADNLVAIDPNMFIPHAPSAPSLAVSIPDTPLSSLSE